MKSYRNSTYVINRLDSFIQSVQNSKASWDKDVFISIANKVKEHIYENIYMDVFDTESTVDSLYRYVDYISSKELSNIKPTKNNIELFRLAVNYRNKIKNVIYRSLSNNHEENNKEVELSKKINDIWMHPIETMLDNFIIFIIENADDISILNLSQIFEYIEVHFQDFVIIKRERNKFIKLWKLSAKIIDWIACRKKHSSRAIKHLLCSTSRIQYLNNDFFEAIKNKIEESGIVFSVVEAFKILWSLGTKNDIHISFPESIILRIKVDADAHNPKIISNWIYWLKNLKELPQCVLDFIYHNITRNDIEFNLLDITKILTWLLKVSTHNKHDITIKKIIHALTERIKKFSFANRTNVKNIALYRIINYYKHFVISEIAIDERLKELYESQFQHNWKFASQREKDIYEYLKYKMPNTHILNNHYIDWIEMDIYFPDLRKNVEIDWETHKINKEKDEIRDQYLFEKHWITTIRLYMPWKKNIIRSLNLLITHRLAEKKQ